MKYKNTILCNKSEVSKLFIGTIHFQKFKIFATNCILYYVLELLYCVLFFFIMIMNKIIGTNDMIKIHVNDNVILFFYFSQIFFQIFFKIILIFNNFASHHHFPHMTHNSQVSVLNILNFIDNFNL